MIHNFVVDYNKSTKIHNIEFSNPESIYSITLGGSKKGIFSGDFSSSDNKHPINTNGVAQKINFYNPMIPEPLHKFWYYINTAKLLRKDKGMMIITLSSTDINLIESLKNLDAKTDEILKNISSNNISGNNIIPTIKLSDTFPPIIEIHVDSVSKCYNQENKICTYMEIMNGAKIQLYIEFDCVMIEANKCEKKWRVIQMKEHKPIDLTTNMFDNIPIQQPQLPYNMMGSGQQIMGHLQGQIQGQIPQMMVNPYTMVQGHIPPYQIPNNVPNTNMPYNPQYSQQIPEQQFIRPSALDILNRSQGLRSISGSDDSNSRSLPIPPISSGTKDDKDKPSGPLGGAVFRPPTAGDLMSMLTKLKKPTKKDDEIEEKKPELPKIELTKIDVPKSEVLKSEVLKSEVLKSEVLTTDKPKIEGFKIEGSKIVGSKIEAFIEEKHLNIPKIDLISIDQPKSDINENQIIKSDNINQITIKETNNVIKNKKLINNEILIKIKDLIKKQTNILDLDIIEFNKDMEISKKICDQIDKIILSRIKSNKKHIIIESASESESTSESDSTSNDSGFEI